ncbi:HD domain-containing protein [Oceanirhabdus sp. W0125-5]|uniref:HD domain-containing protein n=1 Tax=Oceanirhabdus sp. W0125-5 TaxID=2999116 RepID=UPI0022F2DC16|nr:HD domain-containing protein [Oceanirhabdus sp. W0125-5]WBW94696.1 HD domain-containing protein [Oceanirhabdus sp. W0125-5]
MELTVEKARELLEEGGRLNPGQWVGHCINAGLAARNIAKECEGLDENKAQAFAMIHDIGRRVGRTGMRHTLEGYNYLIELGFEDAARICLTHSHPTGDMMDGCGEWDCDEEEKEFVREFLDKKKFDDYDLLCQLADALALDDGFLLIEKRLVGVSMRHGFNDYTLRKWKKVFENKEYFERKIGKSIYDVLPGVIENTFK